MSLRSAWTAFGSALIDRVRVRRHRKRNLRARDLLPVVLAIVVCAPMAVVVFGLFGPAGAQWQHIRTTILTEYVVDTVVLAVGVTLFATVIGTVLAWFTVNYRFPGSRFFAWALGLPIALPAYISAFTYAHITGVTGPLFKIVRFFGGGAGFGAWRFDMMNMAGCVFVMSCALYPYVYFAARAFFSGSSRSHIETARSCGRGDFAVFFRVALPVARPAIVAGAALVLMETLNEYGATSYYGVNTMVTGIFRAWFSLGDVQSAIRLSAIFLIATIMLLSFERMNRRHRRYDDARPRPVDPVAPGRAASAAMTIVAALVLSCGLLIPSAQLVSWTIGVVDAARIAELSTTLLRSAVLAGFAAGVCVIVSLIVVYFAKRERSAATVAATEAVVSGYAIPGAIIVVGILAMSRIADRTISVFLFGSIGLLIYAYVVRYLAITVKPLQAAMAKIPDSFDDAGTLGGRGGLNTFVRIHLPMMKRAVASGLLVASIDLLKELPMTLVLRPFNFDTLATRAFELAQQDRLPEAALPALAIVLVGFVPALLLSGRSRRTSKGTEAVNVPRAA